MPQLLNVKIWLRCIPFLIFLHFDWSPFILTFGHLERHTPVQIMSNRWKSILKQNKGMRSACRAQRRDCVKAYGSIFLWKRLWEKRLSGLLNLSSKHHVWRKPDISYHLRNTIPMVKGGGGSNKRWGCFSSGQLVRVEGKLQNTEISLMKTRFKVCKTSDWVGLSNRTMTLNTQPRQQLIRDISVDVFEGPSQSLNLNMIKYLMRDLKELERIYREE